jgi:DNA-binding SARP family transcriptional activator
VRWSLLGPLIIEDEGCVLPVAGAKVRVVLAALLLEPGRVVPADRLAEAVWGERQPKNPQSALHNLVMRLRRSLGARATGNVRACQPGYVIDVDPSEVDVHAFADLCRACRDAHRAGDWTGCARLLRTALALWRGDPLADVPAPMLAGRERLRLEELRLDALGLRIDADLQLGLGDELIAELCDLTEEPGLAAIKTTLEDR